MVVTWRDGLIKQKRHQMVVLWGSYTVLAYKLSKHSYSNDDGVHGTFLISLHPLKCLGWTAVICCDRTTLRRVGLRVYKITTSGSTCSIKNLTSFKLKLQGRSRTPHINRCFIGWKLLEIFRSVTMESCNRCLQHEDCRRNKVPPGIVHCCSSREASEKVRKIEKSEWIQWTTYPRNDFS